MNIITGQAPYGPPPNGQAVDLPYGGSDAAEMRQVIKRNIVSGAARISWPGYAFMAVFFVAVFEGAGRKWGSAASTVPLILFRDLAALGLILYAWKSGSLARYGKVTALMTGWTCIVVAWGLFQIIAGATTPVILAIGLRFWLLYTWFAVAAAATLTEADYKATVKLALLSLLIMAPLAVLQHYSSTSATVNRQLDGDEESVFTVVTGVVRTTGTFSFTSGYVNFISMVAPLTFALLSARKRTKFNWIVAIGVFSAFAIGSLLSGSRTAVLSAGLMFGAYLIGLLIFSKNRDKPAALAAIAMILVLAGCFVFFLSDAVTVTQQRFEDASAAENFWERTLSTFVGESTVLDAFTWLGSGMGAGSNLATSLRAGAANFEYAETESGRILLEGGLLGLAFIVLKLMVVIAGFFKSWKLSRRLHTPFPLLSWLTLMLGLLTWSAVGQLTANALLGTLCAFFLLMIRYPAADFFPPRRR